MDILLTNELVPEISVIVPIYNTEKYIYRCVDSILAQTFTDFELILVDDGCSDGSPQICDRYAKLDARIRVIHQANKGIATARNNAIRISKGKWLCFVDSDDLLNPYALEYLHKAVIDNNVKMAVCGAIDGKNPPEDFMQKQSANFTFVDICDDVFIEYEKHNKFFTKTVWAKLIERTCVLKRLFDDGRIYEDNVVVPIWLHSVSRIVYSDVPLYFYYLNDEGTVRKKYSIKQLDNVWAKYKRLVFFRSNNYPKMARHALKEYMRLAAITYSRTIKELNDRCAARRVKVKFLKVYFRCLKDVHLSKKEQFEIFECFHPAIANLYYLMKVIKRKATNLLNKLRRRQ